MDPARRFGLALSGGGYRATAFHIGTLRALNRMGLLQKVDVISTISGGSITGAAYALSGHLSYEDFEKQMLETLATKSVIRSILWSRTSILFFGAILLIMSLCIYLLFTRYASVTLPVLATLIFCVIRFQFRMFPVSREIERAYNKFFFNRATLSDLPVRPELVIGSTNLQTSTPFVFSRRKMEDSNYARREKPITFHQQDFPVARAVVASSCVPFAFTPVTIDKKYFVDKDLFKAIDPRLVDGGVFDNQGIHKLTAKRSSFYCPLVLISDAGNKLPFQGSYNNTIILLIRTVDVFMDRIKGFQMATQLYRRARSSDEQIAYQSLGWDLEECIPRFVDNMIDGTIPDAVLESHRLKSEWKNDPARYRSEVERFLAEKTSLDSIRTRAADPVSLGIARKVGTNLTRLKPIQINALVAHADSMTQLQVSLYCPEVFSKVSAQKTTSP